MLFYPTPVFDERRLHNNPHIISPGRDPLQSNLTSYHQPLDAFGTPGPEDSFRQWNSGGFEAGFGETQMFPLQDGNWSPLQDDTPSYTTRPSQIEFYEPYEGCHPVDGTASANAFPVNSNNYNNYAPNASWQRHVDYESSHHPALPDQDFAHLDGDMNANTFQVSGNHQNWSPPTSMTGIGYFPENNEGYWINRASHHSYSSSDSTGSVFNPPEYAFPMARSLNLFQNPMLLVQAQNLNPQTFLTEHFHGITLPNMGWNIAPYVDKGADMVLAPTRRRKIVDSIVSLEELLTHLGRLKEDTAEMFMDEESGPNHCRKGTLSTIQISFASFSGLTYVLDVLALGTVLFHYVAPTGISFKSILENPNITKVDFDLRADVAALDGQYQVKLRGGIDLQLMELGTRDQESKSYLLSLNSCVQNHLRLCAKEKAMWSSAKEGGNKFLQGNFKMWECRPLPELLLDYAASDTVYMPHLYAFYLSILKGDPAMMRVVMVESARRIAESQVDGFEIIEKGSPEAFVKMV